jgi:hypothetical protein
MFTFCNSCYNDGVAERSLYIPTKYIEQENKQPVIFLAGPIQGAADWQRDAINLIHDAKQDVTIASPRRDYLPGTFDYSEQVDWETHHLGRAAENGAILFWLAKEQEHNPERAYAQTTRAELFEWKVKHERDGAKMVIGIEEGFTGAKYVKHRFSQDCPDVSVVNTLEDTCAKAVELIS